MKCADFYSSSIKGASIHDVDNFFGFFSPPSPSDRQMYVLFVRFPFPFCVDVIQFRL